MSRHISSDDKHTHIVALDESLDYSTPAVQQADHNQRPSEDTLDRVLLPQCRSESGDLRVVFGLIQEICHYLIPEANVKLVHEHSETCFESTKAPGTRTSKSSSAEGIIGAKEMSIEITPDELSIDPAKLVHDKIVRHIASLPLKRRCDLIPFIKRLGREQRSIDPLAEILREFRCHRARPSHKEEQAKTEHAEMASSQKVVARIDWPALQPKLITPLGLQNSEPDAEKKSGPDRDARKRVTQRIRTAPRYRTPRQARPASFRFHVPTRSADDEPSPLEDRQETEVEKLIGAELERRQQIRGALQRRLRSTLATLRLLGVQPESAHELDQLVQSSVENQEASGVFLASLDQDPLELNLESRPGSETGEVSLFTLFRRSPIPRKPA